MTAVNGARFQPPLLYAFPESTLAFDAFEFTDNDTHSVDDDVFDASEFFSTEQDLYLVRRQCFDSGISMEQLVPAFQRRFGDGKDADSITARLHTLQQPHYRALFALYLNAVAMNRDDSDYSSALCSNPVRSEFQPLLQSTHPTTEARLLQMIYDDEKLLGESTESVRIDVTSRNFPKYSRIVAKSSLQRCSRIIHELFKQADREGDTIASPNQAFSIHDANTSTERLHFTDSVPFYDHCLIFNHLDQPILDRFLLFIRDPNIVERLTLQRRQREEAAHIKREQEFQIQHILDIHQRIEREKLEHERTKECQRVQAHLEHVLEQDLEHIRRMHNALLAHEKAKIDAKFDEQLAALADHIQAMHDGIEKLQQDCENDAWSTLDRDIATNALQVERIFGTSDFLLRLLILAEDLDAEPLRRALVRYMGKDHMLPQFALRRELTSKMIPESTLLAILQAASTSDLRETATYGANVGFHDLLAREIHTRETTFCRFLAGLTNDQLRAVSRLRSGTLQQSDPNADASGSNVQRKTKAAMSEPAYPSAEMLKQMAAVLDFPDVLDREFTRRREFSRVKMNSDDLDHEVGFSEDDCLLQLEVSQRYCAVLATKPRRQGESGSWMFEVQVLAFGGDGESLLLGWDVPRGRSAPAESSNGDSASNAPSDLAPASSSMSASAFVPGLTPSADGASFGVTWQSDGGLEMGMLHANGQSRSGVACFRAGDVVGCTINQDELVPYLRFYLNGVQVLPPPSAGPGLAGSAASGGPASTSTSAIGTAVGIPCQNAVYCLLPAVCMYSARASPQMRVRFNFRGKFAFPIQGFEAYGAPL